MGEQEISILTKGRRKKLGNRLVYFLPVLTNKASFFLLLYDLSL
jgi:hypothetical protein